MGRFGLVLLALSLFAAMPARVHAQDEAAADARYEAAAEWVNLMAAGDFEEAASRANEAVTAQMNADVLETSWGQLTSQLGALSSLEPKTQTMTQGFHMVVMVGVFAAGAFDVQVAMADDHSVAGFFIRPLS